VVYDPAKISLVDILRWFWEAHDPTQGMGQVRTRCSQPRLQITDPLSPAQTKIVQGWPKLRDLAQHFD
jgi:peptide methionine sulfoxide reductase MsrA